MKCPKCWEHTSQVRAVHPLSGLLYKCLLIVPMRCLHCCHKFHVSMFHSPDPPRARRETGIRGDNRHGVATKPHLTNARNAVKQRIA